MPLRIVHLTSSVDPAGGGPPVVTVRLAAALAQAEQSVTVAACDDPDSRQRVKNDLSRVAGVERIEWVDLVRPSSAMELFFASQAKKRLQELIPQADVLHIHGVWESVLRVGAEVARQHHVPYVVAAHGMLSPWALRHRWWKKKIALDLGIRRMINRAAFLHCLNEDELRGIKPLGFACPMEVISNGVSFDEMGDLPAPGTFYQSRPELNGDPYVLFFGRLHPGKGLDHLGDAFALLSKKHPRLRLVIAGPDAGAKIDFEQQMARQELSDRVHVIGPAYGPSKFAAMVDALCFALPSEHECFSMAVLEALACGVPVVISQESHFPEVEQAAAGFVLPRRAKEFAEAIDRIASTPDLRRQMGQNGLQLVQDRYTWQRVAHTAINAYTRAVAGGQRC